MSNDIKAEHSLGKGEVLSSILSGSTRNAQEIGLFWHRVFSQSAVSSRTYTEDDGAKRGVSVDSVRPLFFWEDHR